MAIVYNSKPELDGLYSECLDVSLPNDEAKSLIPASNTLELTVCQLALENSLGEDSWGEGVTKKSKFQQSIYGIAKPADNERDTHRINILGENSWCDEIKLHFTAKRGFGCHFSWFEASDISEARLFLSIELTEAQFSQLMQLIQNGEINNAQISIDTDEMPGVYMEWHPGVYGYHNYFEFFLLPTREIVKNNNEMPKHFGALKPRHEHKKFQLKLNKSSELDVPKSLDDIWDEKEAAAETKEKAESRTKRQETYRAFLSLLGLVLLGWVAWTGILPVWWDFFESLLR